MNEHTPTFLISDKHTSGKIVIIDSDPEDQEWTANYFHSIVRLAIHFKM
jgi:hypothetical protein